MAKQRLEPIFDERVLQRLWTVAVGQEGYVKKDWIELQRQVQVERARTIRLLCKWLRSPIASTTDPTAAATVAAKRAVRGSIAELIESELLDAEDRATAN